MDTTVLIVSGDRQRCRSLKSLFSEEAFVLISADGVDRARKVLPKILPDVVLLGEDCIDGCNGLLDSLVSDCVVADIPLFYMDQGRVRIISEAGIAFLIDPEGADEDRIWPLTVQLQNRRLTRELYRAQDWLIQKDAELEESLVSATHIQKSLVPPSPPKISQVDFGWNFLPCQKVGGDLFNVIKLDEDHVMLYMLDVSGHGFPAAMVTVAISQTLSPTMGHLVKRQVTTAPYYELPPPAEVLDTLDRIYPVERFEKFFTICYMLLNFKTGLLRYSNAAGPLPLLIRADGRREFLSAGGTIIGMGGILPFEEAQIQLEPGDRVFLFTDGILEQENSAQQQFGLERLVEQLAGGMATPLRSLCDQVTDSVLEFSGAVSAQDDMTVLALELVG